MNFDSTDVCEITYITGMKSLSFYGLVKPELIKSAVISDEYYSVLDRIMNRGLKPFKIEMETVNKDVISVLSLASVIQPVNEHGAGVYRRISAKDPVYPAHSERDSGTMAVDFADYCAAAFVAFKLCPSLYFKDGEAEKDRFSNFDFSNDRFISKFINEFEKVIRGFV